MLTNQNIPQISWKDLTVGTLIGNGSFGDVYQGTWKGKEVAIKLLQIKTLAPNLADEFTKESQILWQCQSAHILNLYGICLEPGHSAMVMEYMSNGSLYHVIHNQTIPEQHQWQIVIDIARGLASLHSQNILHRDLKSFNILLDNNYHAKISDFGLAKLRLETSSASTSRLSKSAGTVRWRAPELFKRKSVATPASDVYSLGMILWELVTKKLPFEDGTDEQTVISWINQGEKEEIPANCHPVWREIIESCWSEPSSRPTAEQIVEQLEDARPGPSGKSFLAAKSWHFDPSIKPTTQVKGSVLIPATGEDFQKVLQCYKHHPVSGYDIKSVEVIYNSTLNRSFSLKMELLQERQGNAAFAPKWPQDNDSQWRNTVHQQWQTMASPYQDSDYPDVKLMPLWHGTDEESLKSILKTGYANLAVTDVGFFGKGIYSTVEAEYAHRVYSKGALVLNWVVSYSAYPVIKGDTAKLAEKGNFGNYDAHFIPVVPANPNDPDEVNYYPTAPQQKAKYHELVVFDSAQCLPRYLVTLQKTLSKSLGNLNIAQPPFQPSTIASSSVQTTNKPTVPPNNKLESQPVLFSNFSQGKSTNSNTSSLPISSYSNSQPTPVTTQLPSSSSNVLIFTPPPAKIVTASKALPKVDFQELAKFLKLVAEGEQGKAEAMLKQNKDLVLVPGDVTDLSGRSFKAMTGFQYALWALDWHMWSMIKRYMSEEDIKAQVEASHRGSWIKQYGTSVSWKNLVTALDEQVRLLQAQDWNAAETQWQQTVGEFQRLVPAHVVNEYCHPTRSFSSCPDFTQAIELPRTRLTYGDKEWFTQNYNGGQLGEKFAYCRGAGPRNQACSLVGDSVARVGAGRVPAVRRDSVASRALLATRTQQRDQLLAQIRAREKVGGRIKLIGL